MRTVRTCRTSDVFVPSVISRYFLLISGWTAYEGIEITTRSHPEAFPSALRQRRKTQTKQHDKGDQGTLVRAYFPLKYSD